MLDGLRVGYVGDSVVAADMRAWDWFLGAILTFFIGLTSANLLMLMFDNSYGVLWLVTVSAYILVALWCVKQMFDRYVLHPTVFGV